MDDLIKVECLSQFDPPEVLITIAGQVPFQVHWGVYDYLNKQHGFPPLICGTYQTQ
jgi:hypothetical protein